MKKQKNFLIVNCGTGKNTEFGVDRNKCDPSFNEHMNKSDVNKESPDNEQSFDAWVPRGDLSMLRRHSMTKSIHFLTNV